MSNLRRFYHGLADRLGLFLRQRDPLMPPARLFSDADRMDGSHDQREFVWIGEATTQTFPIRPSDRVLEVGCGIGRMALPLTRRLTKGGSYDGIDITPEKVDWCRRTITRRYSNFHFHLADMYSKFYNPRGQSKASEYRFPFADATYDFVFLISVFSHMLPEDMENYLREITRVLKPEGQCLSSYFLFNYLTAEGPPLLETEEHLLTAPDPAAPIHRIASEEFPEHSVLYDERYIRRLYRECGHRIVSAWYGSHAGRDTTVDSILDGFTTIKVSR
jgi:SAM-dependent methyltransferase